MSTGAGTGESLPLVEFVGPPGAGKTTQLQHLTRGGLGTELSLDHSARPDGSNPSKNERRRERLWSAARQPLLTANTVPLVAPDRRLIRHMLEVPRRKWLLARRPPGMLLVDEGPLQRLLWVLAMAGWGGDVARAARMAMAANLVVVVDLPEVEAWERVQQRGGESSTAVQMGREEGLRALRLYRRHLHRAQEVLGDSVTMVEGSETVLREIQTSQRRGTKPFRLPASPPHNGP